MNDELIRRIRARAEDPETRTDTNPTARGKTVSVGAFSIKGIDLGAFLRGGEDQTPKPDDTELGRAEQSAIEDAEQRLGFSIPADLRRLHLEVSNGGFGPGAGLMSLAELVDVYQNLRKHSPGPRGQEWPSELLPFTRTQPGHDCIDLSTGAIVVWDEEELVEGSSDKVWKRSFKRDAADIAAWFENWVGKPSPEQQMKDQMQEAMLNGLRQSLEYWREKTPAERAEAGLPDEGWEQELFGHLGIDLSKL